MNEMKSVYDMIYSINDSYNYVSQVKNALVDLYAQSRLTSDGDGILDAGCGQGVHLKRMLSHGLNAFGIELSTVCFEKYLKGQAPAENIDILGFAARNTRKFAGLICMDVLEHIPVDVLDANIAALKSICPTSAFLGIANHSDIQGGVELHVIQEDNAWWMNKLSKYFSHVNLRFESCDKRFFIFECADTPMEKRNDVVYSVINELDRSLNETRIYSATLDAALAAKDAALATANAHVAELDMALATIRNSRAFRVVQYLRHLCGRQKM